MLIKSVSRCQDSSNLQTNVLRNPTLEIYNCQHVLYRAFLFNSFVSRFKWNLQVSIWQHTKGEGNFFVRPLSLFFFFTCLHFDRLLLSCLLAIYHRPQDAQIDRPAHDKIYKSVVCWFKNPCLFKFHGPILLFGSGFADSCTTS